MNEQELILFYAKDYINDHGLLSSHFDHHVERAVIFAAVAMYRKKTEHFDSGEMNIQVGQVVKDWSESF